MRLTTTLSVAMSPLYRDPLDLSTPVDDLQYVFNRVLASGIASARANRSWHDERTITGVDDIDLGGGSLFDAFGVAVVLKTVKAVLITNLSEEGTLIIGAAAAREWAEPFGAAGDTALVPPRSCRLFTCLVDGWPVDPGVADRLRVNSGADEVVYDILVVGTHCTYSTTTTTTEAP